MEGRFGLRAELGGVGDPSLRLKNGYVQDDRSLEIRTAPLPMGWFRGMRPAFVVESRLQGGR